MNLFGIEFNSKTKKTSSKEIQVKSGDKLYFYTKKEHKQCSKKSKKS